MTEKAQRELYLAIRRAKEEAMRKAGTGSLKKIYSACIWKHLNKLLTAPQFNLSLLIHDPSED